MISAVNLDKGVEDEFDDVTLVDSDGERTKLSDIVNVYEDSFHTVIFQDDLFKMSEDREAAQRANDKMNNLVESKCLSFNYGKSVCMVLGDKKAREKLIKELEENPLTLGGHEMKLVEGDKYLGDHLSVNVAKSVSSTIKRRIGLAAHTAFEARSVIDDARAEVVGGLTVAFSIWEMAVIPSLLHNSETWGGIRKKDIKQLDKLQLKFLRIVTGVGKGCPIPILLYHTGTLSMENRIMIKKATFLKHVASLPRGTISRDVFDTQCLQNIGLVAEVVPFLEKLGLSNFESFTKHQFRKILKRRVTDLNKQQLLEMSRKYKKISYESLSKDDFCVNEYFKKLTVGQARLRLKIAARMTPRVAACYPSDRRYQLIDFQCVACRAAGRPVSQETRDTEEHIKMCDQYCDLRTDLNLDTDHGLVMFFKRVIERREEMEES